MFQCSIFRRTFPDVSLSWDAAATIGHSPEQASEETCHMLKKDNIRKHLHVPSSWVCKKLAVISVDMIVKRAVVIHSLPLLSIDLQGLNNKPLIYDASLTLISAGTTVPTPTPSISNVP